MPLGLGSLVKGIWQYGENDITGPLFSDFLNKLGDSIRANVGNVQDATYGLIPRVYQGESIVTIGSGSGAVAVPVGMSIGQQNKYRWVFQNTDSSGAQLGYATGNYPSAIANQRSVTYANGLSGGWRVGFLAIYIG